LPEYQQENLFDIIRHQLIERKRDLFAENIKQAREEYARGEIKRGTVDELMRELQNENLNLELGAQNQCQG
jgi:cation transport regulator ChaB